MSDEQLARWQAGTAAGRTVPAAPPPAPMDESRRSALNAAKLAALVTGRWGAGERERHAFGGGAALTGSDDGRPTAWVLVEGVAGRALGPALLWAERHGAEQLHLIVDPTTATADSGGRPDAGAAGTLARQAGYLDEPVPRVWRVAGTALAPAEPSALGRPLAAPSPSNIVDLLIDGGLEVVVEGGMVRGEINGLEVARIVSGSSTAGVPLDAPLLEVGVGKADRELTAMLHGELDPVDQLDRVIEIVRRHRRAGAPRHPLNQLVPERWLRAVLVREPELVGLSALRPAEGAHARANLRERGIAVARGEAPDGTTVVVACSVGVAPDLVPLAADARAAIEVGARLVLAVPARDDLPGNRRLAGRLHPPATVTPIPGDWRR
ncbi:MAG TPA: hypothetical protein VK306_08035 [Acidimicrobiales bacterium]|nr:hypothetical protein [Acidimicrobiales bacterium]